MTNKEKPVDIVDRVKPCAEGKGAYDRSPEISTELGFRLGWIHSPCSWSISYLILLFPLIKMMELLSWKLNRSHLGVFKSRCLMEMTS